MAILDFFILHPIILKVASYNFWLVSLSFFSIFLYSYRSFNYYNSNSCRSFSLLNAIEKCNGNLSSSPQDSWMSNNYRKNNKEKIKELIPKIKQRRSIKSDNCTREKLDSAIFIYHFGCTINIFADTEKKWRGEMLTFISIYCTASRLEPDKFRDTFL